MSAVVFVGPTLRPEEATAQIDARCLPPVRWGDVYRVALRSPDAIGIIDGYFSGVRSVCHKEILYALSQGIRVYGSASLGALRAAELSEFGMVGVGSLYDDYRDGRLLADDEVAVAHESAERGYRASSEAMVNIRATVARAQADGVIAEDARARLEEIAKSLFYTERIYPRILDSAATAGVSEGAIRAFKSWLPDGRVDCKRAEALAMLERMRADAANPPSRDSNVEFPETQSWRNFVAELRREDDLLDEGGCGSR